MTYADLFNRLSKTKQYKQAKFIMNKYLNDNGYQQTTLLELIIFIDEMSFKYGYLFSF